MTFPSPFVPLDTHVGTESPEVVMADTGSAAPIAHAVMGMDLNAATDPAANDADMALDQQGDDEDAMAVEVAVATVTTTTATATATVFVAPAAAPLSPVPMATSPVLPPVMPVPVIATATVSTVSTVSAAAVSPTVFSAPLAAPIASAPYASPSISAIPSSPHRQPSSSSLPPAVVASAPAPAAAAAFSSRSSSPSHPANSQPSLLAARPASPSRSPSAPQVVALPEAPVAAVSASATPAAPQTVVNDPLQLVPAPEDETEGDEQPSEESAPAIADDAAAHSSHETDDDDEDDGPEEEFDAFITLTYAGATYTLFTPDADAATGPLFAELDDIEQLFYEGTINDFMRRLKLRFDLVNMDVALHFSNLDGLTIHEETDIAHDNRLINFWNLRCTLYPDSEDPLNIELVIQGPSAQWKLDELIRRANDLLDTDMDHDAEYDGEEPVLEYDEEEENAVYPADEEEVVEEETAATEAEYVEVQHVPESVPNGVAPVEVASADSPAAGSDVSEDGSASVSSRQQLLAADCAAEGVVQPYDVPLAVAAVGPVVAEPVAAADVAPVLTDVVVAAAEPVPAPAPEAAAREADLESTEAYTLSELVEYEEPEDDEPVPVPVPVLASPAVVPHSPVVVTASTSHSPTSAQQQLAAFEAEAAADALEFASVIHSVRPSPTALARSLSRPASPVKGMSAATIDATALAVAVPRPEDSGILTTPTKAVIHADSAAVVGQDEMLVAAAAVVVPAVAPVSPSSTSGALKRPHEAESDVVSPKRQRSSDSHA
ncbi:hypothetical protein H9P43_005109 [Blastocladiella emersonii ATCC 22665]|nr:hypothetical protein H9P43_005109 [Blastocladiella emersonii ATCC 22665]